VGADTEEEVLMSGSRVLMALVAAITSMVVAQAAPAHGGGSERATASLARDALRAALTRERFYFVMPDRLENGDPANDTGGLTGPREVTGFDPTSKGWYHGGDLEGG